MLGYIRVLCLAANNHAPSHYTTLRHKLTPTTWSFQKTWSFHSHCIMPSLQYFSFPSQFLWDRVLLYPWKRLIRVLHLHFHSTSFLELHLLPIRFFHLIYTKPFSHQIKIIYFFLCYYSSCVMCTLITLPSLFFFFSFSWQFEGAYLSDGKGLNNWDVFTHTPGSA